MYYVGFLNRTRPEKERRGTVRKKHEIIYNSIAMFFMCVNIIITFTAIYMLIDFLEIGRIVEHQTAISYVPVWIDNFTRTLYFSAITLLSVGYGDITPFGWSRGAAILEATIGYILPAAITVQYLRLFPMPVENWLKNRHDQNNKDEKNTK